jgi:hypothetical protein
MHRFYFNDCLPQCSNQHTFIQCFSESLIEFGKLADKDLAIEKAIITEKLPSQLFLGNAYTLEDSINNITDRDLKRLAFTYFIKYPIHTYFQLDDDLIDRLLGNNYSLTVNKHLHSALNLAMVAENGGFLFTVALHSDLKRDNFELVAQKDGSMLMIDNLHGSSANTLVIQNKLESLNAVNLSNIERLKHILDNYTFSKQFEKDFPKLTNDEQESIIEHFIRAKNRRGITPFYADGSHGIIRDVTPSTPKCNVYELRVFSPSALRVFFNESGSNIFLSHIFFKGDTNQNKSIKKAHDTLHKLILTA